jgi:hypothetical protein
MYDELVKSTFILFCHSVLDTESSHFDKFWTPVYTGVTGLLLFTKSSYIILFHLLFHDLPFTIHDFPAFGRIKPYRPLSGVHIRPHDRRMFGSLSVPEADCL